MVLSRKAKVILMVWFLPAAAAEATILSVRVCLGGWRSFRYFPGGRSAMRFLLSILVWSCNTTFRRAVLSMSPELGMFLSVGASQMMSILGWGRCSRRVTFHRTGPEQRIDRYVTCWRICCR